LLSTLDLATGTTKPLSDERWSTCGRIEWLRDGSGIAMIGTKEGESNSARRDQVYLISYPEGRARRLTNEGGRFESDSLGVTNDGAILAVPFNRSSQIWEMNANGDATTASQMTSGAADGRSGLTPLTDGRVAYIARSADDLGIWLMNADGSEPKQIGDSTEVQDLAVTPDGKHLIYSNEVEGRNSLYRMDIDGTDVVQLTDNDDFVIDSTVSPDGTTLVYDVWKSRGVNQVVKLKKVPFGGGESVTISEDGCSVPRFSPNGQYISCVYFDKNQFAFISAADGCKIASFDAMKSPHMNTGGIWTPDSRALAYIVHQNNICNIWTQPIDGGKPKQLTNFTSGACYNLAYSFDGSRLYIARGHELRDAVLITNYK
jgi:Tol biopolymer transport system component